MHEVSIALGMIEELKRIASEHNARQVTKVKLKIGKMSGIVTDSLIFAFDVVKLEHPFLSAAEIEVEEVPLIYKCRDCGHAFGSDDNFFPSCPNCPSMNLTMVSGREQDIDKVELEV